MGIRIKKDIDFSKLETIGFKFYCGREYSRNIEVDAYIKEMDENCKECIFIPLFDMDTYTFAYEITTNTYPECINFNMYQEVIYDLTKLDLIEKVKGGNEDDIN